MKKTIYLFGEDQCRAYAEGIDALLEWQEETQEGIQTFIFLEGVTPSIEFANAMLDWYGFVVMTEEDYNKLI